MKIRNSHLSISRPPPPRPKGVAPGHGHPLIKRGVNNNESDIRAQMEDVESEMKNLEIQGAKLEDMLRFKTNSGDFKSVNTLKIDKLKQENVKILRQ